MLKLVKELFWLAVGAPIFILLFIVGIVYSFIKHIIKFDYSPSKQLVPIVRSITLLIDCLANAGGGELLNDVFKVKKDAEIKYGQWYRTISSVTGLRYKFDNEDNRLRRVLDKVLGENHSVESISKEDLYYYSNK